LQKKIKQTPITVAFPDYTGPNEYSACVTYIESRFLELNKSNSKQIYVHVCCATDPDNVKAVFNAAKDIILRNALADAGFMV